MSPLSSARWVLFGCCSITWSKFCYKCWETRRQQRKCSWHPDWKPFTVDTRVSLWFTNVLTMSGTLWLLWLQTFCLLLHRSGHIIIEISCLKVCATGNYLVLRFYFKEPYSLFNTSWIFGHTVEPELNGLVWPCLRKEVGVSLSEFQEVCIIHWKNSSTFNWTLISLTCSSLALKITFNWTDFLIKLSVTITFLDCPFKSHWVHDDSEPLCGVSQTN